MRDIKTDTFSCDTNAGFPSANVTAFTVYALIVVWHLAKTVLPRSFHFLIIDKYLLVYATVLLLSGFVWLTRLYFLYEFLHQCLMASVMGFVVLELLIRFSMSLLTAGKLKALILVVVFSLVPIAAYYVMLYLDEDPFWSVRMVREGVFVLNKPNFVRNVTEKE